MNHCSSFEIQRSVFGVFLVSFLTTDTPFFITCNDRMGFAVFHGLDMLRIYGAGSGIDFDSLTVYTYSNGANPGLKWIIFLPYHHANTEEYTKDLALQFENLRVHYQYTRHHFLSKQIRELHSAILVGIPE